MKRKILPQMDVATGFYVRTERKQTEQEAIKLADQAMYKNKEKRKLGQDGDQERI